MAPPDPNRILRVSLHTRVHLESMLSATRSERDAPPPFWPVGPFLATSEPAYAGLARSLLPQPDSGRRTLLLESSRQLPTSAGLVHLALAWSEAAGTCVYVPMDWKTRSNSEGPALAWLDDPHLLALVDLSNPHVARTARRHAQKLARARTLVVAGSPWSLAWFQSAANLPAPQPLPTLERPVPEGTWRCPAPPVGRETMLALVRAIEVRLGGELHPGERSAAADRTLHDRTGTRVLRELEQRLGRSGGWHTDPVALFEGDDARIVEAWLALLWELEARGLGGWGARTLDLAWDWAAGAIRTFPPPRLLEEPPSDLSPWAGRWQGHPPAAFASALEASTRAAQAPASEDGWRDVATLGLHESLREGDAAELDVALVRLGRWAIARASVPREEDHREGADFAAILVSRALGALARADATPGMDATHRALDALAAATRRPIAGLVGSETVVASALARWLHALARSGSDGALSRALASPRIRELLFEAAHEATRRDLPLVFLAEVLRGWARSTPTPQRVPEEAWPLLAPLEARLYGSLAGRSGAAAWLLSATSRPAAPRAPAPARVFEPRGDDRLRRASGSADDIRSSLARGDLVPERVLKKFYAELGELTVAPPAVRREASRLVREIGVRPLAEGILRHRRCVDHGQYVLNNLGWLDEETARDFGHAFREGILLRALREWRRHEWDPGKVGYLLRNLANAGVDASPVAQGYVALPPEARFLPPANAFPNLLHALHKAAPEAQIVRAMLDEGAACLRVVPLLRAMEGAKVDDLLLTLYVHDPAIARDWSQSSTWRQAVAEAPAPPYGLATRALLAEALWRGRNPPHLVVQRLPAPDPEALSGLPMAAWLATLDVAPGVWGAELHERLLRAAAREARAHPWLPLLLATKDNVEERLRAMLDAREANTPLEHAIAHVAAAGDGLQRGPLAHTDVADRALALGLQQGALRGTIGPDGCSFQLAEDDPRVQEVVGALRALAAALPRQPEGALPLGSWREATPAIPDRFRALALRHGFVAWRPGKGAPAFHAAGP